MKFPAAIKNAILRRIEKAGWAEAWLRGEEWPRTSAISLLVGPESAMQVSALSACVRLISGNVAKLPCHVFRMIGDDARERVRNHPISELLNVRPNSWQTAHEFRRMLTAHVALYGNAYALKRMVGARVVELIPWHPSYVRVTKEDEVSPPVYELRPARGGPSAKYSASDILHLRDLSLDGVLGLSRIEQARQGISLSLAAETYGAAYFQNGAEAGVALQTDSVLKPEQRTNLIKSWKEAHQGASRAHAPTVLEGGLKIQQLSMTNRDSQFLELRTFQVEDIARLYGVPAHLIGLTEKQTSWGTGVEQQSLGFLEFHLLDWLVMWETAIRRDCLSEETDRGVFVEHVVEGLLRADIKTRMDAYAAAIQNGILSRNEVRQKENLKPYPEGAKYLFPSNMSIAGEKPIATPVAPPVLPGERPRSAWRTRLKAVQRAITERESA